MSLLSSSSLTLREGIKISDEEFKLLTGFIYDIAGIAIPEKRKYLLENRLAKRLKKHGILSYNDYYTYLKYGEDKENELTKLLEAVTTNETSFYRDINQLDSFQNSVLTEVLGKQRESGSKQLHIWSAGCSSGEEPYTLSMLLHATLGNELPAWRIRISANDISQAVLAQARAGVYKNYALRTTSSDAKSRYFSESNGDYAVKPEVKKLVTFSQLNLNDSAALKKIPRSHIIFCRNVIIYFDDEMKKKVISNFYDNLLPGGYLILGHSESIHKLSMAFQLKRLPGTIVYKKE